MHLPAPPAEAERWEHLVVANFRGKGDRDLLLQATNAAGYRMGRFLAAYALDELLRDGEAAAPLWARDDFLANAHNGARIADLDGDGRHEVLGGDVIGPDGERLFRCRSRGTWTRCSSRTYGRTCRGSRWWRWRRAARSACSCTTTMG